VDGAVCAAISVRHLRGFLPYLALLALACEPPTPPSRLARGLLTPQAGPVLVANPVVGDIDSFGWAIALSADWAVVGAPAAAGGKGTVFIYDRHAGYGQVGAVSGSVSGEHLGMGVAITGDGRVVATGESVTGVVKILARSPTWQVQGTLSPNDPDTGSGFPSSVTATGAYVLVGAMSHSHGSTPPGPGAVYVFQWSVDHWSQLGEIPGPGSASNFGQAIAMKGSLLAVGAPGTTPGRVYAYNMTNPTSPSMLSGDALKSGEPALDMFGERVAVDTNTVLGCAWNMSTGPTRAAFSAQGTGWSVIGPLGTPSAIELGTSVDLSAGLYVAGGTSAGTGTHAYARFFTGTPEWVELVPTSTNDGYGGRVAVEGGAEVLVGAAASNGPGLAQIFTVRRALDDPCTAPAQCASGWCIGNVCAERPDGGQDDAAVPDDAGDDATAGDAGVEDAHAGDAALDDAGADGPAAGDGGAPADAGTPKTTDFYSCDCSVGAAHAGAPGLLLALVLAPTLGRRRRSGR
jgi:MYXO-CTERM domain-containing protein